MLSAAVATWLLTFAYDYPTFLLAALGVGIAGGSFAVGRAVQSEVNCAGGIFPKSSANIFASAMACTDPVATT